MTLILKKIVKLTLYFRRLVGECPDFEQCLTFVGYEENRNFSASVMLVKNKTKSTYRAAFNFLTNSYRNLTGCELKPYSLVTDNESALRDCCTEILKPKNQTLCLAHMLRALRLKLSHVDKNLANDQELKKTLPTSKVKVKISFTF